MGVILCVALAPQCQGRVETCFSRTTPEHGQQVAEQVPGHQVLLGRDKEVWRKLEVNPEHQWGTKEYSFNSVLNTYFVQG